MSNEQQTFDKLRQTPFEDVLLLLDNIPKHQQLYGVGGNIIELRKYYSELTYMIDIVNFLKLHGWELTDFQAELEKDSIKRLIADFNKNISFPGEILDRVKVFFPNAKLTQASIELE